METLEKESIAKRIRETLELLNVEIAEAGELGLTVSVNTTSFVNSKECTVRVVIYETIKY